MTDSAKQTLEAFMSDLQGRVVRVAYCRLGKPDVEVNDLRSQPMPEEVPGGGSGNTAWGNLKTFLSGTHDIAHLKDGSAWILVVRVDPTAYLLLELFGPHELGVVSVKARSLADGLRAMLK